MCLLLVRTRRVITSVGVSPGWSAMDYTVKVSVVYVNWNLKTGHAYLYSLGLDYIICKLSNL